MSISAPRRTEREAEAGTDERVAAEEDRDRRVDGRTGSARAATDRGRDPARRRSEANRSSGLGQRRFVRAEPMGEQDARVDDGRVAELGEPVAERLGPVAVQEQAEDRPRRPRLGVLGPSASARRGARPQAALLDERADPAGGVPLEPARGSSALVRPVTTSSARRSAATRAMAAGDSRTVAANSAGEPARPRSARRRAGCRGRPRAASDAARSVTVQPARSSSQRGSALSPGRSGMAGSCVGPGDRDRVGRVAVVGERARLARRGGLHEGPPVGRRSPAAASPSRGRRAPSAPRRSSDRNARSRAPNGVSSGGPATSRTSSAPASPEAANVSIADDPPEDREEMLQRAGVRAGLGVEDADDDAGHRRV